MELRDGADEAAFRAQLRAWLRDNLPRTRAPEPGRWDLAETRDWSGRVYRAGYAGLTWPKEWGGQGLPLTFEAIYLEESARAGAPEHVGVIGLGMVGPTLIAHGTDAQRERHLRPILDGTSLFCQGFSEPEAGSDLSAVRTRIDADGAGFRLNGHKVWSSYAHLADRCLLLARAEPSSGHAGLACVLVDMRATGVQVRPLRQITGDPLFHEILLTDVKAGAGDIVGAVGDGWRVAMTTLAHERGTHAFALTARLELAFRRLLETARATGAGDDPLVLDTIAQLWVDLQGLRFTNYRSLAELIRTGVPGPAGAIAKLCWSQLNQRVTALAVELLGHRGQLDGAGGWWNGYWQYQQLRSRGNSIEGGTSEILRTVIAERVLTLPRYR